jgi:hypothetical protein
MGWKEKSEEIAGAILEREIKRGAISEKQLEYFKKLLAEAAMEGMKHECDVAVMPLLDKLR